MHTRMRLEGSGRGVAIETWGEIHRNHGVWRHREGESEKDKEREKYQELGRERRGLGARDEDGRRMREREIFKKIKKAERGRENGIA